MSDHPFIKLRETLAMAPTKTSREDILVSGAATAALAGLGGSIAPLAALPVGAAAVLCGLPVAAAAAVADR
ncbi:MAG: hypothetical protein M3552_20460, partial [Planctomycetota bacterium]|nr:hypothetical protein [Planctomycetota bacterium]